MIYCGPMKGGIPLSLSLSVSPYSILCFSLSHTHTTSLSSLRPNDDISWPDERRYSPSLSLSLSVSPYSILCFSLTHTHTQRSLSLSSLRPYDDVLWPDERRYPSLFLCHSLYLPILSSVSLSHTHSHTHYLSLFHKAQR